MEETVKTKKKFKMPHAFAIMCIIILLMCVLTYIIPPGEYQRAYDETTGRELVVPGTFTYLDEANPQGLWAFVRSLYSGCVDAADIIFFIVFATAYAYLLETTGALNAMTGALLRKLGKKDYLLIPIFMMLFALGGTSFGMFEETYALIPAFIAIALTMGYDRVVGGGLCYVGVATGFAAAILNPFTIGIASPIAGVPLVGTKITLFRVAAFICFMTLTIWYTMRYAARIKKDPTKSVMYGDPHAREIGVDVLTREQVVALPFTTAQKITIAGFLGLIIAMGITVGIYGWYLEELSGLFLCFFIFTALVNKMKLDDICNHFVRSAEIAMFGSLLVGFARSVNVIMDDANIIDTAVYGIAGTVQNLPGWAQGVGMLVVQNIVNFFIPSGSGQAAVMMPIMSPLADAIGLPQEIAITAYQFGDGFSNMFWPTAVATECGIMGIAMDRWYKFITPLFGMMFLLQAVFIVVGTVFVF